MTPLKRGFYTFFNAYQWLALIALSYTLLCGLDYGDVVQYTKTELLTPIVKQGEFLKVKYNYRRVRTCELTRIRVIIDGAGEHHVISRDYFPGYGNVTDPDNPEEMEVRIKITPDLAPGKAQYRAILSYECPLVLGPVTVTNIFAQYTPKVLILPDVPFTILPARK